MVEVANKQVQQHQKEAIWPESRFVFIGYNDRDEHMRVFYFDGAKIG
jgi:hypothetical protein